MARKTVKAGSKPVPKRSASVTSNASVARLEHK